MTGNYAGHRLHETREAFSQGARQNLPRWSLSRMTFAREAGTHHAPLSSALATIFRGKLCDVVLRNRPVSTFAKDQVIYGAWKRVRSTTRVSSSALSSVRPLPCLRPPEECEAVAGTVHAIESGDRNVGGVVEIAAEAGALTLLHADDGEFDALDADGLIERRGVAGEERGAHGIADDGDEGARAIFLVGEEAAIHHADVAYARHGGGGAEHVTVFADGVVALDIGDVLAVGAVEHAVAVGGFDEARVVGADGLVALHLFEVLAAAEAAGGGDLRDHEGSEPKALAVLCSAYTPRPSMAAPTMILIFTNRPLTSRASER